MKKNFLQDVIPANQKRSIRDIPLPTHKEGISHKKTPRTKIHNSNPDYEYKDQQEAEHIHVQETSNTIDSIQEESTYHTEHTPKQHSFKNKSPWSTSKKLVLACTIGIVGFIIFSATQSKAEIIIQPKKTTQNINLVIPLDTNSLITKTQINKTATRTVIATGEQQVEKQASGKIKIINTHKQTPQELVKNTRFQAPNGYIYRIKDSIVIPGYTMNGNSIVPGTLEVEVFADSAGEEYNISNTTFTIPGFEGKEQFEKIKAESIGEINGGYIGMRKIISDDQKETIKAELENELKKQIEQIDNESTEYVLIPDMQTLSYGVLQDKADGDNVVISLSANVSAYSFKKQELSNFIGQNSIQEAIATDTFEAQTDSLNFTLEENQIKISGDTTITWLTNKEELKKELVNKKRSEIYEFMNSYKSLQKVETNFSPFWKVRMPSDPEKIEIRIKE